MSPAPHTHAAFTAYFMLLKDATRWWRSLPAELRAERLADLHEIAANDSDATMADVLAMLSVLETET